MFLVLKKTSLNATALTTALVNCLIRELLSLLEIQIFLTKTG